MSSPPNSDRSGRAARRALSRSADEATRRLERMAQGEDPDAIRITIDKAQVEQAAAVMGVSPYRIMGFCATVGMTPGQILNEWSARQAAAVAADDVGLEPVPTEAGEQLLDDALESAEILAELLGPQGAAEALGVQEEPEPAAPLTVETFHGYGPVETD